MRAWLRAPGSLSRRLARLGRQFEVQILRQGTQPLRAQELKALGLPRRGCTFVREVILRVDGTPLVWARSSLHTTALAGPWRSLKGLGSRPLANLLYADPRVKRSELQPRRLSRNGHTRRQMKKQWLQATGVPPSAQMLWSRNSVFSRGGADLRVMELFVPDLAGISPKLGGGKQGVRTRRGSKL